jgi:hypothetical protein
MAIHVELKAQGRGVSRGRIERLMRHHGIRAIMAWPRRVRTTDSRHDFPVAPNLLDRNFTATAPNRIWLADITYVETDQGWLYLATVMDLYSRRIVGWAMQAEGTRDIFAYIEGFYNPASEHPSGYVIDEKRFCWLGCDPVGYLGFCRARSAID